MNKILFLPLLYSRGRFSSSGGEIARYIYVYDGQGNIVRSIDIFAPKEYTYVHEEGRIVRATESAIILSGEIVTYKTVLNTIQFVYDSEGRMTQKIYQVSVGVGFVWPCSLDISATYSYYTYRGSISISNKIKNFVNKETKGLKP